MSFKSVPNGKVLTVVTLFAVLASCLAIEEATHDFAVEPRKATENSTSIKESTDTLDGEERVSPLSFLEWGGEEGIYLSTEELRKVLGKKRKSLNSENWMKQFFKVKREFLDTEDPIMVNFKKKGLSLSPEDWIELYSIKRYFKEKGITLGPENFITQWDDTKGIFLSLDHIHEFEKSQDLYGAVVTLLRQSCGDLKLAKLITREDISPKSKDWSRRLSMTLSRQWVNEGMSPKKLFDRLKLGEYKHWTLNEVLKQPIIPLWTNFVVMSARVKVFGDRVYTLYETKIKLLYEAELLQAKVDYLKKQGTREAAALIEESKTLNGGRRIYLEKKRQNDEAMEELKMADDKAFIAMRDVLSSYDSVLTPVDERIANMRKEMYATDNEVGLKWR